MHAPFLSCCELWYGTNRIYYDFVLRKTWYPEILLSKMQKSKVPQWLWIPTKAIWHDIQNQNLSRMLLVWALNFVKLLWPLLRFSSCTHDQDTRAPTNKIADSYTESYAQTCFFRPLNNYSIQFIICPSQKIHMPKRIVWAMLKKEKKQKISMPKGMREKNAWQRAWRKEKKQINIAHTFK